MRKTKYFFPTLKLFKGSTVRRAEDPRGVFHVQSIASEIKTLPPQDGGATANPV